MKDKLGKFLVDKLRHELTMQGHRATGVLIDSMRYTTNYAGVQVRAKHYAKAMENGLPKGTRVPIDALIKWVEVKGIATGEKEIKNAAYAIRGAIIKEGSPTSGAWEHTKNTRRTGFIEQVLKEYHKEILKIVREEIAKEEKIKITNLLKL